MQSRGIQFTANQRCEYCESPAFARPFYLFPCAHAFHCDCVMLRVHADPTLLDAAQRATVSKVEDQIASLRSKLSQDTDKRAQIQLEYLQSELDGFVGADCPLCGFAMVRSIGQSLLSSETDEEVTSWML